MGCYNALTTTPESARRRETMALISDEIRAVFEKIKVFSVATAAPDGTPNVAPIAFVLIVSDDEIWLGDNFMKKTLENARRNPRMAIYAWDPDTKRCFQVKGSVEVRTEGPEYEKMRGMIKAKNEAYPAKSLLILRVSEVFSCTPGPGAGDRIA
jgi:predicted pyridoxine 5'-phosphate oxidase superfamily flavin-nucleotide-binding protein